ncbi:lipopolysaccharide core biosynthesis protein RfaZ, partial [Escherichia coli]|nr:lipopolysaccharide core biosynthesis protein RfaZ [Escherichia coli]
GRWLLKTIYRLSRHRKYHHNKNYWYFFRVRRSNDGSIKSVKHRLKKIRFDTDYVNGGDPARDLLLIATGPSVRDFDANILKEYEGDIMGVNGAIALSGVGFRYYCIIDPSFVRNKKTLVRSIVCTRNITLFCNCAALCEILGIIQHEDIVCSVSLMDMIPDNTYLPINGAARVLTPDDKGYHWFNDYGFSHNADRGIFDYGTVTFAALQVAVSLGYRRILILGLDMNNFNAPRFYESRENMQPTHLESDYDAIMGGFSAAADYCKLNNIKVLNLSPCSSVKVFPVIDISQVLSN